MNEDMREVINEFLIESNEGLDRLDSDLVELETDPTSREALGSIFRTMHTIKGRADSSVSAAWRELPTRPRTFCRCFATGS